MKLQEAYLEAKQQKMVGLSLMIEFLVVEKKVLSFDDDSEKLQHYFKPNNKKRMNQLLNDYRRKQF
ncbi:hypothetical protein [Paraliobacillus ryukyuensis]|uniref:hypothetical protein n=1 Tax=Paraliobacillus ryukyuensis TaxID=200904 RepID=UPI00117E936B|nr:hypothetical protein [Paraliobacillus ryukyuensis]